MAPRYTNPTPSFGDGTTFETSFSVPDLARKASYRRFYTDVLSFLLKSNISFLLGGSYALAALTGIARHTKDIDIFVYPHDYPEVMKAMKKAGYQTETTYSHWLGKVSHNELFVDMIFSSGNGLCDVDEEWFRYAPYAKWESWPIRLTPPEEMIWTKAFVMERHRYDGADIIHLFHACGPGLDWARLLKRFETHWEILLSHLTIFSFVYPGETWKIPNWVWRDLWERLSDKLAAASALSTSRVCYGSLLSWEQYAIPIHSWKYRDARLNPIGKMSKHEICGITKTMKKENPAQTQWWTGPLGQASNTPFDELSDTEESRAPASSD